MKMGYTIALTIGILLLITGLILFGQSVRLIKNGNRAVATVIELERVSSRKKGSSYTPIFQFKTLTNEEIIYKYHSSSSPPSFDIGDKVPIVYEIDNPENARILTYFGSFIWTIILLCISMPLIVLGGGYFFTQQFLK